MLKVMLYSAVIVTEVKYTYVQEKLRVILKDLLINLLAQVTCKYKVTILIYFQLIY